MQRKFETQYGYFNTSGNEYIIKKPGTPRPWINVISNGLYGLTISQVGGGFSWYEHSQFNRITRWYQDLIRDNWGKYFYVVDEESGEVWNPTWLPTKTELDYYECRHGFGYTVFLSEYKEIRVELTVFVPRKGKHEIWQMVLTNLAGRKRRLSIYTYLEWSLGIANDAHREFQKSFIQTEYRSDWNAILARKRVWEADVETRGHWNTEYPYTAFWACSKPVAGHEGDKEAFLGRYGDLRRPAAITRSELSNNTGMWNDSVASLHLKIELDPQQKDQMTFLLGIEEKETEIESIIKTYFNDNTAKQALKGIRDSWHNLLNKLEVDTPDESLNLLVNKWLKYQAISGHLWGRAAYYQQSGAIGFRDQLQGSQVFLPLDCERTRRQIELHARHQFIDGSVLHWWHPITDKGLKNCISDNLLWLPFIVLSYLEETGDDDFLHKELPFYDSDTTASLFSHCCRAIDYTLKRMSFRGIPLIGGGDWNDGLNGAGLEMKGESFWLAHFLFYILNRFTNIASRLSDEEHAERYREASARLQCSIEEYGWDGDWFLRATTDNGGKIGSQECEAGKVFLNAQIWAVISNSVSEAKQDRAMQAVGEHLVKDFGPLLLFPAYHRADAYIGYLSRYAPGSRENGGVYMHAATWLIWALGMRKEAEKCYRVFQKICPIRNGMNPERYYCEPYVTPGNIDGPDSVHYGRGGWTWYTGSATWLQKVIVDWILGIRATDSGLLIDPCIPQDWKCYSVKRIFRGTCYHITVHNPHGKTSGIQMIRIDGKTVSSNPLPNSAKRQCTVEVTLG